MIEEVPDNELLERLEREMEERKDTMPFSFRAMVRELIRRYIEKTVKPKGKKP